VDGKPRYEALADVTAGRSGGFRLSVSVDRTGRGNALVEHGADVVRALVRFDDDGGAWP
jgi:hypothetical protein